MKQSILLLTFFSFALQLTAQITINRSDNFLEIGDTVFFWAATDLNDVAIPTSGTNQVWDYSNVPFDANSNFRYFHMAGTDADFPTANVVNHATLPAIVPGLMFSVSFPAIIDEQGFRTIGRRDEALDVSITSMSGGPNDSLNFLETVSVYEDPVYSSLFPMSYNDAVQSDFVLQNDFLVTIAAYGLDHVPANASFVGTIDRNTIGWGKLTVPDIDNGGTLQLDVLLVEEITTKRDTFILGGAPAPTPLLTAFGLVQGRISVDKEYSFWAKGLSSYALKILVDSDGNQEVELNKAVINAVSSTRKVAQELLPLAVAPNPAFGDFNVAFDKTDSRPWNLFIFNTIGQKVYQETVGEPRGTIRKAIALPSGAPGMYHLVLQNSDGVIVASEKVLRN